MADFTICYCFTLTFFRRAISTLLFFKLEFFHVNTIHILNFSNQYSPYFTYFNWHGSFYILLIFFCIKIFQIHIIHITRARECTCPYKSMMSVPVYLHRVLVLLVWSGAVQLYTSLSIDFNVSDWMEAYHRCLVSYTSIQAVVLTSWLRSLLKIIDINISVVILVNSSTMSTLFDLSLSRLLCFLAYVSHLCIEYQ